jgi:hypothetical protein
MTLGYTDLKALYDREHFLYYDIGIQPSSYERWTPYDTNIKVIMFNKEKEREYLNRKAALEKRRLQNKL